MKTIEERAQEYAHQYRRDAHDLKGERADAAFAAYCQGAEDEHKELTKWNGPERHPNNYHTVLLKIKNDDIGGAMYAIGYYEYGRWRGSDVGNYDHIVGWREIHE